MGENDEGDPIKSIKLKWGKGEVELPNDFGPEEIEKAAVSAIRKNNTPDDNSVRMLEKLAREGKSDATKMYASHSLVDLCTDGKGVVSDECEKSLQRTKDDLIKHIEAMDDEP